jgi:glycerol kinase
VIIAIDQGTSSTKACLFEPPGVLAGSATVPVSRLLEPGGAVTQDPHELVQSCRIAVHQALREAGIAASQVHGVALANQGESFLLFDAKGRPATPVISWQDTRCGDLVARLRRESSAAEIERCTGLPLHAEFTAPKLAYHLSLLPRNGWLRSGTLDTWLVNRLDPRHPFITDRATSSRTMLIGLADTEWNDDLLACFGILREVLPRIVPCDAPGAVLELEGVELPLLASGYDTGLVLLGHGCLQSGETKATFGTCLGVMSATGGNPVTANGLLTAIAYGRRECQAFALDGEIAAAGALIDWATRLGIAPSAKQLGQLAASVPDAGGAVIVPAMQGLGAPHWRDDVSGVIAGLTAATGPAELCRAVLEAIAWSLRDVLGALRVAGFPCPEIRVDGGLVNSATLLQLCADIAQTRIVVTRQAEATAFGAAALAMLATGKADEDDVRGAAVGARYFDPGRPPPPEAAARWEAALERALSWNAEGSR